MPSFSNEKKKLICCHSLDCLKLLSCDKVKGDQTPVPRSLLIPMPTAKRPKEKATVIAIVFV